MKPLVNPTGMPKRGSDRYGLGSFGAPRDGGKRKHLGLDLQAQIGQQVLSPIDGKVIRIKRPYGDGGPWDDGLLIAGVGDHQFLYATLYYLDPLSDIVGMPVAAGEPVGIATGLQGKYPEIVDHVHFGLEQDGEWIDPEPLLFPHEVTV